MDIFYKFTEDEKCRNVERNGKVYYPKDVMASGNRKMYCNVRKCNAAIEVDMARKAKSGKERSTKEWTWLKDDKDDRFVIGKANKHRHECEFKCEEIERSKPERWELVCPRMGTRLIQGKPKPDFSVFFLPIKAPLNDSLFDSMDVPMKDRFSLKHFFENEHVAGNNGIILNLTMYRFYAETDLKEGWKSVMLSPDRRNQYDPPTRNETQEFISCVNQRLSDYGNGKGIFVVHDINGYNRTGFLICAYLVKVDSPDWVTDTAIDTRLLLNTTAKRTTAWIGRMDETLIVENPMDQLTELCDETITWEILIGNCNQITKLGEGCYADVYRVTKNDKAEVWKVVPFRYDETEDEINNLMPGPDMLLSEVAIGKALSKLNSGEQHSSSSFIKLNFCRLVYGKYAGQLLEPWKKYKKQKGSENTFPGNYDAQQRYVVFSFADGGKSLEHHMKEQTNRLAVSSICFFQTAYAVAVAEAAHKFEHRDLHEGNLLLMKAADNVISFRLHGNVIRLKSYGVQVSIIDYTLSRMEQDDGTLHYMDMAQDPELFTSVSDAPHEQLQYDVYRSMKVLIDNDHEGKWNAFCPKTTLLWLQYLATRLSQKKFLKDENKAEINEIVNALKDGEYENVADFLADEFAQSFLEKHKLIGEFCLKLFHIP
ncbi:haspin like kinase domain-containing protein [Ditylenchus destructor]|uniref:non-specific serine/threonine protein kinase n=1 Tax=Ditylenchus destructor TaxID=166010 RepID=A0AAD4MHC9_9BILA|nr:haspin like kinase domain-containing protein [Ditylenchus destructor]